MVSMLQQSPPPEPFHILSFEGPDAYSRAGGIASRVTGLTQALSAQGHPTSLWFVGDPQLPGQELQGAVQLHRWCQWISAYHPAGAYDGEEGKVRDYASSLPPHLLSVLKSDIAQYGRAVVLAEEWHTADAVLHLDKLLRQAGLRDRVALFWNANNTFGFHLVDWKRLNRAATLLTVSRYMRRLMQAYGVDPVVIHNGLGDDSFAQPTASTVQLLRQRFSERTLLTKVARWDPDKRWLLAVDIVAMMKSLGAKPLLVARGGLEAHEAEVLSKARQAGLRVREEQLPERGERGLLAGLRDVNDVDVLLLRSHLDASARAALFQAADAVLANSGHEPFGLVGLEAMAVGGLACTGASGEDYVLPGHNALMLQQNDPAEFVRLFANLRENFEADRVMRRAGMRTAQEFAWAKVVHNQLLPHARRLPLTQWPSLVPPVNPSVPPTVPTESSTSLQRQPESMAHPSVATSFSVFSSHRKVRRPALPSWLTATFSPSSRRRAKAAPATV